ncbi:MAG TPA: hypothetical protein PKA29_01845 [Candidatus Saccharibacteria bacterium]|jgi:hypothetical protein|nr:hypothetical protein [Candidatus Saccharibacteria bacterium]
MIIETSQFKTKGGVSDEQLLTASQQAQDNYLAQCKGYESRTLAKHTDGTWLDIVVFASTDDAQAALQGFNGNPHTKAFEECIDPQTARMNHWEIAKQY